MMIAILTAKNDGEWKFTKTKKGLFQNVSRLNLKRLRLMMLPLFKYMANLPG